MKIKINRNVLSEQLKAAVPVCGGSVPILQSVKMDASGGRLSVTGTNLDVTVRSVAECEIESEGSVALPARFLQTAVNTMSSESVTISDGGVKTVLKGNATYRITGHEVSGFPTAKEVESDPVGVSGLPSLMSRVSNAMADEREPRNYLRGVLVDVSEGSVSLVASDGKRMSVVTSDAESSSPVKCIVPAASVGYIQRLMKNGRVSARINGNCAEFFSDGVTVFTKLVDGTFPDYASILPRNPDITVEFNRQALLEAVRMVSVSCASDLPVMGMSFSGGTMKVEADNGTEDANAEVSVEHSGDPVVIHVNPRYVQDILSSSQDETMRFEIKDGNRPFIISGEGFRGMIMPIRI